jgi:hypothetical protein
MYDERLRHLTLTGFSDLTTVSLNGGLVTSLLTMNLTRNAINYVFRDVLIAMPQLQVLDLSHNRLEELDPFAFSQVGSLRALYLQGNDLTRLAAVAPQMLSVTLDLNLGATAAGLTPLLQMDAGLCALVPDARPAATARYEVACEPSALDGPLPTYACGGGMASIYATRICDGVDDCADGSDERRCAGFAELRPLPPGTDPNCEIFVQGFLRRYSVRNGVMGLPVQSILIDADTAILIYDNGTYDYQYEGLPQFVIKEMVGQGFFLPDDENVFRINYRTVFVNDGGTLDCTATFDVVTVAPTPPPTPDVATSSSSGVPLAAPIGGAVGAITLVLGLGALLLLWQRRRTDELRKQLAAPVVPCEVALAVSYLCEESADVEGVQSEKNWPASRLFQLRRAPRKRSLGTTFL